jgi:hypothetical protein
LICLGFGSGHAAADVIRTFEASGTFNSGSVLSGTVTIDTTTGIAEAVDLVASAPASLDFTFIQFQAVLPGLFYEIITGPTAVGLPNFNFGPLDTTTLINYDGGPLYPGSDIFYSSDRFDVITNGALTAIPEPSSWALLGIGLLGVSMIRRYRPGWRFVGYRVTPPRPLENDGRFSARLRPNA